MTNLTVRLEDTIDLQLSNISEITNIPKSSLILYALNEYFRQSLEIRAINVNTETAVRSTLRIGDYLNQSLLTASSETGIPRNGIVNFIIKYYIDNVWNYH